MARWWRNYGIAGHRDTCFEELTFIGLILGHNPDRNRLQALKSCGGFKVGTLLATVQCCRAFRAVAPKIDPLRKRRGATEAPRSCHSLDQPREPRSCHIDRRSRPGRPGTIIPALLTAFGVFLATRILVATLPVLTFAFHSVAGWLTPLVLLLLCCCGLHLFGDGNNFEYRETLTRPHGEHVLRCLLQEDTTAGRHWRPNSLCTTEWPRNPVKSFLLSPYRPDRYQTLAAARPKWR